MTTLIEIKERHKSFHSKIAAQAKIDTGISCPSASNRIPARGPIPPSAEDIARWTERQRAIPIPVAAPIEPLFSIIAEVVQPQPITVTQIINAVAAECNLTRNDILSARRLAPIVRARQIAMYLAKELTGFSFPALGRRFGYRDHTTVLHGVRKIERLYHSDIEMMALVERVRNKIKDAHNARHLKAEST
jgi:hypothetical protein